MNDVESRLRRQAGEFAPEPPLAIRERAMSAIEGLEIAPSRASSRMKTSAGIALVVLLVCGIVLFQSNEPAAPLHVEAPNTSLALQRISFSIYDPAALMQRYFNHPLESEMKSLSQNVAKVADTVSGLLPAPAKEIAPQT